MDWLTPVLFFLLAKNDVAETDNACDIIHMEGKRGVKWARCWLAHTADDTTAPWKCGTIEVLIHQSDSDSLAREWSWSCHWVSLSACFVLPRFLGCLLPCLLFSCAPHKHDFPPHLSGHSILSPASVPSVFPLPSKHGRTRTCPREPDWVVMTSNHN